MGLRASSTRATAATALQGPDKTLNIAACGVTWGFQRECTVSGRQFAAVALFLTALVVSVMITTRMCGPSKTASIQDLIDRVHQTARERN